MSRRRTERTETDPMLTALRGSPTNVGSIVQIVETEAKE